MSQHLQHGDVTELLRRLPIKHTEGESVLNKAPPHRNKKQSHYYC